VKIVFYSAKSYDQQAFDAANVEGTHELIFLQVHLNEHSLELAAGARAICVFVNDVVDATILEKLAARGIEIIALRCAGFNNVDVDAARRLGISVVRVPAYSPHAVAEHTLALILTLNRKIHRAYNRVREGNFALEGLLGVDMHGLSVGVVGTGRIGANVVRILEGFGCKVLMSDPYPDASLSSEQARYVEADTLWRDSDIISLHCPLTPDTHHLIDNSVIETMKPGAMLINTSRGGLIDSRAVIGGLKTGRIGALGLDVYEEEADLFFEDLSGVILQDDVFARLLTFPNVVITGHQGFFTSNALQSIACTTLQNLSDLAAKGSCENAL
jgi:D-lactate dehydrogenase